MAWNNNNNNDNIEGNDRTQKVLYTKSHVKALFGLLYIELPPPVS